MTNTNDLKPGDKVMAKRLPWDPALEATVYEQSPGTMAGYVTARARLIAAVKARQDDGNRLVSTVNRGEMEDAI